MKLSKEEIKAIIPHRDPMLLVDTVEEMEPGDHIVTTFFVDPAREIFKGHFPGEPVLPGVYSVECMAQTADILLLSAERYAGKIPLFLGINNVRFLRRRSCRETPSRSTPSWPPSGWRRPLPPAPPRSTTTASWRPPAT